MICGLSSCSSGRRLATGLSCRWEFGLGFRRLASGVTGTLKVVPLGMGCGEVCAFFGEALGVELPFCCGAG